MNFFGGVEGLHTYKEEKRAAQWPLENGESWEKKEIQEQDYVSQFILDILKANIQEDPKVEGPVNFKTGDLYHLKSDISIKANFNESLALINKLHPTPAVSGLPQEKAISYLSSAEGYDREYYSGYLGTSDSYGKMNYFVNLRCTQVFKEYFEFYAGAGITEDSDPVQEYVETSRKISALKKLVHA